MSQQAGILHFDRKPISDEQFCAFEHAVSLQGPDRRGEYREPGMAMLHRAFDVTAEDAFERQPLKTSEGNVLMWDGRLDNRQELLALTGKSANELPTDAQIVAEMLAAWGPNAFPRLAGDWALTLWNRRNRSVLFARDYAGLRRLYYLRSEKSVYWCTDLAALVLHSGERYSFCDEYFAGYLSSFAEAHLTPYVEIMQVPPGAYVEVTQDRLRTHRYWSFNRLPNIRYQSDAEYEEHFRQLFRQSVKRRLRTSHPILAELSGGLDSSSIVCMADDILKRGESTAKMDTVSYYSFGDTDSDERKYFEAIEDFTGRRGTHLEEHVPESGIGMRPMRDSYFAPLPGYFDRVSDGEQYSLERMPHRSWRTRLSGIGGDELLGGVQDPIPDLAATLWRCHFKTFGSMVQAWALQRKTTVWALTGNSLVHLMPIWMREHLEKNPIGGSDWICPDFARRQRLARRRIRPSATTRELLPGPTSPDSNYFLLTSFIAGYLPSFTFAEHVLLPYYDRDLVQFLLAIPGEQLLRPAERRSLMRRALKGIVPDMVLLRKTKALGQRLPSLEMKRAAKDFLATIVHTPALSSYINHPNVKKALDEVSQGQDIPTIFLEHLLAAAYLCHSLEARHLLSTPSADPDFFSRKGCRINERTDLFSVLIAGPSWRLFAKRFRIQEKGG
jgi:asparagine synthase (glutamine-hydrolysing)